MDCDAEREFTFTWNIVMAELFRLTKINFIKSPIAEAQKLKRTQWYLTIFLNCNDELACSLYRKDLEESEAIVMKVTFKLEMIDSNGRTLKTVVKEGITFSKGSSSTVWSFPTLDSLELLKQNEKLSSTDKLVIRCHIIEECHKKQVMIWDVPTVIQTQWEIKITGASKWSKNVKAPFHEYSYIDINLFTCIEKIYIRIGKVDLVQPFKLKIAVLNDEGREIDFKGSTDGKKDFETWIKKELVEQSCLTYAFTLICIISISSGNSASEFGNHSHIGESFPSKTASRLPLQEDLKEMLLKEKHSDVKLRSHDKVIPVHKCLLSARSPVFASMFDHDMLETQTGIVDIPDVENETLREFLEFLYTDTITFTDCDEVLKLMLVADKYQVNILKDRCAVILMTKLSIENICEVVSVAEMVNQSKLKKSTINFIKANKKKILSTPVWSEWMKKNTTLANEILLKLIID